MPQQLAPACRERFCQLYNLIITAAYVELTIAIQIMVAGAGIEPSVTRLKVAYLNLLTNPPHICLVFPRCQRDFPRGHRAFLRFFGNAPHEFYLGEASVELAFPPFPVAFFTH